MRKIREQGGTNCKLFRTDMGGKWKERRVRRMKDGAGRMVNGEEEVLEVMEKHWNELGRTGEDTEAEMGDVGGHELVMCGEVSWEEVVEIMKYLKRGIAAGPDGILNEMLMCGGGRLVAVMLLVMSVMVKSESCPLDLKQSLLVPVR